MFTVKLIASNFSMFNPIGWFLFPKSNGLSSFSVWKKCHLGHVHTRPHCESTWKYPPHLFLLKKMNVSKQHLPMSTIEASPCIPSTQGIQWPLALAQLQGCAAHSAVLLTALSAACAAAALWPRALELAQEALGTAKEDADGRGH